ncbi:MAG: methyltransferase domain-containing protein [Candidatus Eisenbacteria bacterium]|nr:methyltransferase domain-containing protein [Candidatus Eisenbacteria bacterium]
MIDESLIAAAHDAMEAEYDQISDLWYGFLFNRIHDLLLRRLLPGEGQPALDVGCGTGYQSFLMARAGYRVTGFDISTRLLAQASRKAPLLMQGGPQDLLFQSPFPELMREQSQLLARADVLRRGPVETPLFRPGTATDGRSYEPGGFAVITCCGSVLSFIDEYEEVLKHMHAALKPGGLLLLEVEQRTNLDLFWPFVDWLLRGALHYQQDLKTTMRNLVAHPRKHLRIEYPFELVNGNEVDFPLWLFSTTGIESLFRDCGFRILARRGVHAVTNLIPSTTLHHPHPAAWLIRLFRGLASIEKMTSDAWPVSRLGCSAVYCLQSVGVPVGK